MAYLVTAVLLELLDQLVIQDRLALMDRWDLLELLVNLVLLATEDV